MFFGITGNQSQRRSGHCCTYTACCEAHSLLVQVVPAIGLPIMCNSDHDLQTFNIISITMSTPSSFGPGYRS